ncbi:Sigma-70 region 2 [Marvinbryantia formatexigens DSM 14469]|uniref:Sigma-70 region 2 n=1 Tax=Marvinbryantia formatexigens DSM 14469 TaxID=478749 RepID=C6LI35_9FIRM|nr:sigma-70 family RNA polymerase sigma factor [Marvinbryantia formatexigens]EET59690.1 Sigma-70 region 2 [Marvinbryantia formatexigens DSM 14469]UWO26655.1 sigma-70 family RNA polymerase sigma factor [Marvinbryantia formatexigens DSM 14469]SDG45459.1 RNA polymerase sigma factor, sigma-70 family [Marvinbryantia formatexigens]
MTKHETFTENYKRYGALVMKSVVAQTKDKELAAEICQQTFLHYYRVMDTVDETRIKAWLLHVAKNLLIDYWRKASTRREFSVESTAEVLEETGHTADMEKQCADRMFICQLLEDLKEANELWFEVIYYIFVLNMSYDETAKLLDISPATLRARMYRAKNYIKEKYGSEYL